MPRSKSSTTVAAKKPRAEKKAVTKTVRPKKTKSILVDVIEDEPIAEPAWPQYKEEAPVEEPEEKKNEEREPEEEGEEIDNQKKYFSSLAAKLKESEESKTGSVDEEAQVKRGGAGRKRHVGLYRRLVVKFIILVAILAAIVFYFSFSTLKVGLTLRGENISDTLLLKIADTSLAKATSSSSFAALNDPRESINGVIKEIDATTTKTYPSSGETYMGEAIVGQVRLINNSSKNQALVATTRLLSPDNKLFRIKNAVNIPAGGEVVADIYADKPSADLAIEPTTFTIPGLWVGLQDKIFAKSDAAFTFSKQVKKYVTSSDLEAASKDINDSLADAAKKQVEAAGGEDWMYLASGPATVSIDAKVGDKKEEFAAKASGKIIAISFSKKEVGKLAAAKLNLVIPDDKELNEFKPENIAYSFDNYDPATGSATIKATFGGTMILKSDAQVIDPAQLVNLSADQLGTYLKSQPEVKDYELDFSPSFIKKAPSLVDRIKIEVKSE